MRYAPFFLVLCCILSGCRKDTRYHHYCHIPMGEWGRADTLVYRLPQTFTYHTFGLEIGVRNTETYPYRDLWLAVIHPLSPAIHPDTVRLWLADDQGNWNGEGTANSLYQYTQFAGTITCYPADSVLQIVHLMGDSILSGVSDVGMKLTLPPGVDAQKDE